LSAKHGADEGINYETEDLKTRLKQLTKPCQQGLISPHIHASFALVETATALSLIEGRKVTGKVIVNPQR
jgi:NADPH:quinone reductase-like Zn-dependent oxidoreductase